MDSPLNEGRGVNPGARTTRLPSPVPLNEGRGVNPGDTHRRQRGEDRLRSGYTLNEGRGVNPGDTPNFSYGRWYETELSV